MLKFNIFAITVAMASSAYAVTEENDYWSISITGLDQYLVGHRSAAYGLGGRQATFNFELPDGADVSAVQIRLDTKNAIDEARASAGLDFGPRGHAPDGVALSNSTVSLEWLGSVYSETSPDLYFGFAQVDKGRGNRADLLMDFQHVRFVAGTGLNPSSDANCTSFECMTPYVSKGFLQISFSGELVAVPEPSAALTSAIGLMALGAIAARRKATARP